jgi:hypothetical protein
MNGAIAMTKPKPARTRGQSSPEADLGPAQRIRNGALEIGYRADPDQPSRTVKGARVRVWYHAEWSEGRLTDAQHEAADLYSFWSEEAELLRHGKPAMRGGPGGGAFSGPSDRLVWLLAQLRAADAALDLHRDPVKLAICWNLTPEHPDAVRVGLRRLAEFWGM